MLALTVIGVALVVGGATLIIIAPAPEGSKSEVTVAELLSRHATDSSSPTIRIPARPPGAGGRHRA